MKCFCMKIVVPHRIAVREGVLIMSKVFLSSVGGKKQGEEEHLPTAA